MNFDKEETEKIFKLIADLLDAGSTEDMIHDALKEHFISEDDIYLLIQADTQLYKYRTELKNQKPYAPIFRRVK